MIICKMTAAHIAAIAQLENDCFADPWTETTLAEELHNSCAVFLVALIDDNVVGYLGCHHIADEGYVTNIAVSKDFRRQGIARQLLRYAKDQWQHLFRITLEVRVSNTAAIALYESEGFSKDGIRPSFYRHPTEDAAIYSYYTR